MVLADDGFLIGNPHLQLTIVDLVSEQIGINILGRSDCHLAYRAYFILHSYNSRHVDFIEIGNCERKRLPLLGGNRHLGIGKHSGGSSVKDAGGENDGCDGSKDDFFHIQT